MKISNKGLALVKQFEGLQSRAYICNGGKLTIGYGHTSSVDSDDVIAIHEAEQMLISDCRIAENSVAKLVKIPLNANQFDALVSFVFNVGRANFARSALLKKLNRGDVDGAANEFLRWVYAKQQVSKGLMRRRQAEKALFLQTD